MIQQQDTTWGHQVNLYLNCDHDFHFYIHLATNSFNLD